MLSLTQYLNLDNPYDYGQKQIGLHEDAAMQNGPLYCVKLPFGLATFKTPNGSNEMSFPMGYVTDNDHVTLQSDVDTGRDKVPTFPKKKADALAAAWGKLGYRVHVCICETETVMV